jgi:hypothetical protein
MLQSSEQHRMRGDWRALRRWTPTCPTKNWPYYSWLLSLSDLYIGTLGRNVSRGLGIVVSVYSLLVIVHAGH